VTSALSQERSGRSQRRPRILTNVNAKKILRPRTFWRWGLPVGVVAVVAVLGSGVLSAGASPSLPTLTPAQLLAAVEGVHVDGFSGQVVENAALGLPELPDLGGSSSTTSMVSLLSGSHTARVWYAGPDKQRFALLGTLGETDIFHDGTDLWQWDSDSLTAVHTTLPASAAGQIPTPVHASTLTPDQLAQRAIAAIDPSTAVTVDQTRRIAGRSAYDLVLAPRDQTSRIGSVHIGIDAQTKLPLSVQVFPRGDAADAAIDISFSSIDFAVPPDSEFDFTPPKSAKVTHQSWDDVTDGTTGTNGSGPRDVAGSVKSAANDSARVFGSGWTSVVRLPGSAAQQAQLLANALTPVQGSWGTGRLFTSKLISALIVDNGSIYVGAVDPSVLYQAAAQK
jgi:outer membrane lipoprotein-sorting protein